MPFVERRASGTRLSHNRCGLGKGLEYVLHLCFISMDFMQNQDMVVFLLEKPP